MTTSFSSTEGQASLLPPRLRWASFRSGSAIYCFALAEVGPPRSISRPATRRQRVIRSGVGANSGGMEALQRSSEKRQRGAKLHPSGSAHKSGGMPEIASSRSPKAEPSTVEVSSAAV